jgi:hypothetical protein
MKQQQTFKLPIPRHKAKRLAQLLFNVITPQEYMLNPSLHQFFTEFEVKETMV